MLKGTLLVAYFEYRLYEIGNSLGNPLTIQLRRLEIWAVGLG